MLRGRALFDELLALTGVSPMLASGMMTRALADRVSIDDATASDYAEALPRLRARLKAYLPPEQADERAQAILLRISQLQGTPARLTPGGLARGRVKADIADRARAVEPSKSDAPTPGPMRGSGRLASPAEPVSGEWEDPEITLAGRRWTADELAIARGGGPNEKK